MSAPHLATPTNFFLHLAFSGPLSSPHAYATRAGPTLDWPLSSYKPGSPRALTCSPLRACQSCLPGAQRLIRVAPISHLLCGLLALSSASLHRLVSQSTRNMIDWLGFLFPCAFLYTTNSPVACGVRVCKLLPCSNLFLPFPFATCLRHACLLNPRPAFVFLQALHSPRATLQPSSHAPIVSVRRLVYLSLAFTRLCLPDTRLLFHVRRIQHSLQAFLSAPHLATPTNFFLGLAFSGPLSSPHAYATRACPTLGWPLSSYKPGSPRALTCSPLRACQSCLPGAWCVFLLPSPQACALCIHPTSYSRRPNFTLTLCSPRAAATRAYGLLALSSAPFLYSLHRLVLQSTRNMIDWLRFLFPCPCAFLYTTDSLVACGVRVCKLLPYSNLSLPFPFATCLRHACLLNPRPAFVFLQALHSPHATLQPSSRVPIVSVRRLVRLSLAFTRLCHSCLPDTRLLFVLDSPPWPDKRHKV